MDYLNSISTKNSISFFFEINYTISSCSIYRNKDAIVIAGNTNPTKGTKIEGK